MHWLKPFTTKRNITSKTIEAWAKHPLGERHLCMVGEVYKVAETGWAATALTTASSCIEANFGDVLSAAAMTEMRYIVSGCNNHSGAFPNERFPTEAPIPGHDATTLPHYETYYNFKH